MPELTKVKHVFDRPESCNKEKDGPQRSFVQRWHRYIHVLSQGEGTASGRGVDRLRNHQVRGPAAKHLRLGKHNIAKSNNHPVQRVNSVDGIGEVGSKGVLVGVPIQGD